MPTTRKKVIKTVYKDEASEDEGGDFSDSGSEAKISEESSSEEHAEESSGGEFNEKSKQKGKAVRRKKTHFTKDFMKKLSKQTSLEDEDVAPALFTVKDLTEEDKQLPAFLNLSESDSSDDETSNKPVKRSTILPSTNINASDSEHEAPVEYKDVWSNNIQDESEDIAKKTFMELEQHKNTIEQAKVSLQNYISKTSSEKESNVKDLLALGEEASPKASPAKVTKSRRNKHDSDSDVEDWEEVKESKSIPQQGLQLFVELPDTACRKRKKVDVEMMMKRKINRVKKEYQVYMHKVHVLCWLGHGNYVSRVLNDQELMAAALAMVPKGCYPEERLNMKYVEQITTWYKDKLTLKENKNENKFRPKAPPLKIILLDIVKSRVVTAKKYSVYIFVSMLRALGLQCRIMLNFVTLPLKPPSTELCSLSTKTKDGSDKTKTDEKPTKSKPSGKSKKSMKIPQVDGNYDSSDSELDNIMQVDGSDDTLTKPKRSTRQKKTKADNVQNEDVSPPKRPRRVANKSGNIESTSKTSNAALKSKKDNITDISKADTKRETSKSPLGGKKKDSVTSKNIKDTQEQYSSNLESKKKVETEKKKRQPSKSPEPKNSIKSKSESSKTKEEVANLKSPKSLSLKKPSDLESTEKVIPPKRASTRVASNKNNVKDSDNPPKIIVTNEVNVPVESKFFSEPKVRACRKRTNTAIASGSDNDKSNDEKSRNQAKTRAKSAPGSSLEKSKYFEKGSSNKKPKLSKEEMKEEENLRVSHRDLSKKSKPKNDVTDDLVGIIKNRIKEAKVDAKKGIVKGKIKQESDEDSDFLPEEDPKHRKSDSDDDFKPTKITPNKLSPKPGTSKKIDRRVLSPDEEVSNKVDVWCEIFVEELEQWIAVDVIRGKIHCPNELYSHATHPVCYVVGWDNNNYLKDLTRRYVPHWNTVTRKQRAEPDWWRVAIAPWIGPKTAKDKEEDEQLDRMQLEAPLPKSIAEYKNHPLYALKRHLLKFEAIYPPDASTLGFVRGEAVYARECVYTCRSRDTWLKEAKVVKLGEQPYKIVKARPKWDKLSNKLITDKPLEVFGPWQVQDYEPPVAENGLVPRNAYGNVELFKDCMLPKGTVHIKLPGLNKVAKKLNIDCAPAMTGFDFNGGWSHPVYDGFVVCKEFEEIVTEAWVKDQEDQVRREREKIETRVYGNWKKLIKGLLIKERLKLKYGFEEPTTSQSKNKKGPRLVVKKK